MLPAFQVRRRWSGSIDLALATIVINFLSLAIPITIMQIYDRIIINHALGTLLWLLVGSSTAILLEVLLRWIRASINAWMGAGYEHEHNFIGVTKILSMPSDHFQTASIASYFDKLSAVSSLRNFYGGQILQTVLDVPFSMVYLIGIFILSHNLALITAGISLALFMIMYGLRLLTTSLRQRTIQTSMIRSNFLLDIFEKIALVKAYGVNEEIMRQFEKIESESTMFRWKLLGYANLSQNIGSLFQHILQFAVLCMGARYVFDGSLTIGALTASSMLASLTLHPIQNLMFFWFKFAETKMADEKFSEIRALPALKNSHLPLFPEDIRGFIQLTDIGYTCPVTHKELFKNLNLSVEPETTTFIYSRDTQAISRLFGIVAGHIQPEAGQAVIDIFDLTSFNTADMRGRVDIISGKPVLYKGTLLENLTLFDPSRIDVAMDAAALLGLDGDISALATGFDTQVDSSTAQAFPVTMLQRIAIARIFARMPRIILLEASGLSLDEAGREHLKKILVKLKNRSTIIIGGAQTEWIDIADNIYALENGGLRLMSE
jgi:ABC-type bacteriocin/lantibiotic exporter with double-glycine peptidase domain